MPTLLPRYLTRQEAADHARVSVATLDRWIRQGLPRSGGRRPGRKILIRLDELEEFIERR